MSMWFVKKDGLYLDGLGGPRIPPPRWVTDPDDATRYGDRKTALRVASVYGGRVVSRKRVSFKARAEKAEAAMQALYEEVSRLEAAITKAREVLYRWDNTPSMGDAVAVTAISRVLRGVRLTQRSTSVPHTPEKP